MSRLRLAVIGCGAGDSSRARGYLETAVRLTDLYDLCALCDRSPEVVQVAGERFGVAARYTDAEEMLSAEKPDAVFVLVPTDGQTVFALTAARHGAHVITEIPYGLTLAYGDAIARTCRERGLKWEIAENVWRWPRERLKQEIVAAGLIGEITHARLWYAAGSYHGFNAIRMLIGREPERDRGHAAEVEVPPDGAWVTLPLPVQLRGANGGRGAEGGDPLPPFLRATELERRLQAEYVRRYGHDPVEGTARLLDAPFDRLSVMWTVAGWL